MFTGMVLTVVWNVLVGEWSVDCEMGRVTRNACSTSLKIRRQFIPAHFAAINHIISLRYLLKEHKCWCGSNKFLNLWSQIQDRLKNTEDHKIYKERIFRQLGAREVSQHNQMPKFTSVFLCLQSDCTTKRRVILVYWLKANFYGRPFHTNFYPSAQVECYRRKCN